MNLTRDQKLKIVRGITDENYLRIELLIPLYRNMGKFIHVHDNHGPNEKGTDIVLIKESPFGDLEYVSIILKTKPINNATTGKDTASNVIQQIMLAHTSGYDCSIKRQNVKFNSIMVVTNQTISGTAQESLNKLAANLTQVTFQTGEQVVTLLDAYYPDFYYYQLGSHSTLAAALRRKCEKLTELKNLPQFSVEEKHLIDVFVQPSLWINGLKGT